MNKRKLATSIFFFLFFLSLIGCAYNASLVNTTHDMLTLSKESYDTTGAIVKDLYKQGRIDEGKKQQILNIARPYSTAHNELVESLAVYEETKDASEVERIEALVNRISGALGSALKEIQRIIGGE